MGLLLPDSVVRDVRAQGQADLSAGERDQVCEEFTRELRRIDSYLELVRFPERAAPHPGLVPGAYHIVRWNPTMAPTVEALVDRFGQPLAMGSWVFDKLRKSDLWSGEAQRDRERMDRRAVAAKEAAKARERADHREELRDRLNAATRTSVSMVPGWSQNAAGKKGRKA
jgi:hypothetical protein